MSSNISAFANLITTYTTWTDLSAFLTSPPGGRLRIESSDPNFALIRYVKGQSDLSIPHVRAFRSVVWDKNLNRPVCVTPFKSHDGETIPTNQSDLTYEYFHDGVMIGAFWDTYNNIWRIHTRSTLDAKCRYYSQTKTFADMFNEANPNAFHTLEQTTCYTFVLQHPENRIVCTVVAPKLLCVQESVIQPDATFIIKPISDRTLPNVLPTEQAPLDKLNEMRDLTYQGIIAKNNVTGERWKIRTELYNMVRQLRGNSPRRDYLWLTLWRQNRLPEYLKMYPEEQFHANAVVQKWKNITNSAFHIYTDVFKARSMDRMAIPAKFRPLVYGLHNLYRDTLKPANKSLDWRATMEYMNQRDIAQMLFVVNWDVREAAKATNAPVIPLEPSSTVGTEITEPSTIPMTIDETTVDITHQTA
jgi:hypothetical protein